MPVGALCVSVWGGGLLLLLLLLRLGYYSFCNLFSPHDLSETAAAAAEADLSCAYRCSPRPGRADDDAPATESYHLESGLHATPCHSGPARVLTDTHREPLTPDTHSMTIKDVSKTWRRRAAGRRARWRGEQNGLWAVLSRGRSPAGAYLAPSVKRAAARASRK